MKYLNKSEIVEALKITSNKFYFLEYFLEKFEIELGWDEAQTFSSSSVTFPSLLTSFKQAIIRGQLTFTQLTPR